MNPVNERIYHDVKDLVEECKQQWVEQGGTVGFELSPADIAYIGEQILGLYDVDDLQCYLFTKETPFDEVIDALIYTIIEQA